MTERLWRWEWKSTKTADGRGSKKLLVTGPHGFDCAVFIWLETSRGASLRGEVTIYVRGQFYDGLTLRGTGIASKVAGAAIRAAYHEHLLRNLASVA